MLLGFSFLIRWTLQPVQWCCTYPGWVFHLIQTSLDMPSQIHQKVCWHSRIPITGVKSHTWNLPVSEWQAPNSYVSLIILTSLVIHIISFFEVTSITGIFHFQFSSFFLYYSILIITLDLFLSLVSLYSINTDATTLNLMPL